MRNQFDVVHKGQPAHTAWSEFYRQNKIFHFIPDTMTVPTIWPPTSNYDVNRVARDLEILFERKLPERLRPYWKSREAAA